MVIKFEDCVAEKLNLLHEAIVSMANNTNDSANNTTACSSQRLTACKGVKEDKGVGGRINEPCGPKKGTLNGEVTIQD